jgi:protein-L-isoaspartate(D-aspartate) O-methyltransferase
VSDIELLRRHYAEGVAWRAGVEPGPLLDAFARVPRERFLGPGPWPIRMPRGYRDTPDDDPRHLCHDVLVGLVPKRQLNNGMPSFLATLIDAASIRSGDHVVHLGAGVGYYTAVMAEVAGPAGRVTAIEADPKLAARAIENLADRDHVEARHADGVEADFEPADVIFVNFGMTHPLPRWVERLKPGGRLILALTGAGSMGAVLRFERRDDVVKARVVSGTSIFPSVSGRDPTLEVKLAERFRTGGPMAPGAVTCLRTDAHDEDDSCWLHVDGACLSTRPLASDPALDPYVGTYRISQGTDVVFHVEDGALHIQSPIGGGPLEDLGGDRFVSGDVSQMRFVRDDAGAVTSVVIDFGGNRMQAKRVA